MNPPEYTSSCVTHTSAGKYHCPITFKEFNENSHIVVLKTSGNVYSSEAVEELNAKAKNWKDLLTGEPFTRKDIITIQVWTLCFDCISPC
jgi:hypothetical protein